MAGVTIYSTDGCPFCTKAKSFLAERGISYGEIEARPGSKAWEEMKKKTAGGPAGLSAAVYAARKVLKNLDKSYDISYIPVARFVNWQASFKFHVRGPITTYKNVGCAVCGS